MRERMNFESTFRPLSCSTFKPLLNFQVIEGVVVVLFFD